MAHGSGIIINYPQAEAALSTYEYHQPESYIAQPIQQPRYWKEDLARYERMLEDAEAGDERWIKKSINYLLRKQGKRPRYRVARKPDFSSSRGTTGRCWRFSKDNELILLQRHKRKGHDLMIQDHTEAIAYMKAHQREWLSSLTFPKPPNRKRNEVMHLLLRLMVEYPGLRAWRRSSGRYSNMNQYWIVFPEGGERETRGKGDKGKRRNGEKGRG